MGDFFAELRKRKIWWVAGVYLAVSWVIFQLVALMEGTFSLPVWVDMVTVIFLAVGFPVAILLAWAQETQAAVGAAADDASPEAAPADDQRSLEEQFEATFAVLPFDNFTNDDAYAGLADGLSEDIITSLSYTAWMAVSARNSSFQFKGASLDVPEIGRRLGVNFVLEGSIRIVGDMLRITSQLIETSTDKHIWADRIDEPLSDIGARQDAVIAKITESVIEAFQNHAKEFFATVAEEDLPPMGLIMRASSMPVSDGAGRDKRKELLLRAIELVPNKPQPRALLNAVISFDYAIGFSNNPERDRAEVMHQAEALLSIAGNNGPVLTLTGMAYSYISMFDEGIVLARQGYALSPDTNSRFCLAFVLTRAGQLDEGLELLETLTAKGVNGREREFSQLQRAYVMKADFDAALEISDTLAIHFGYQFLVWFERANIQAALGQMDEAKASIKRVKRMVPRFTIELGIAGQNRNYAKEEHRENMAMGLKLLLADEQAAGGDQTAS